MAGGEPAQQQTQQGHQPAGATQPWQQGPNLGHLGLRTAAASAARTPTEHSCIRNVAARTYFETTAQTRRQASQCSKDWRGRAASAASGVKHRGRPASTAAYDEEHGMPTRHVTTAAATCTLLFTGLGSSLPADLQTHCNTNSPTNMGGGVNTANGKGRWN